MSDKAMKPKKPQTQTTPTGLEIPIPERDEFFRNLEKVAKGGVPKKPAPAAPTKS